MAKVVIFLGPPGAGKGTQVKRLAEELDMHALSTGEMLRDHIARGTALGAQVKPVVEAGGLVSDATVIEMIRERLAAMEYVRVLFDGFPRTVAQAEALEGLLDELSLRLTAALLLEVPEELLLARLSARAATEGRADDTPATIRTRFAEYTSKTRPLVDHYAAKKVLHRVDGTGTPDEVYERLRDFV